MNEKNCWAKLKGRTTYRVDRMGSLMQTLSHFTHPRHFLFIPPRSKYYSENTWKLAIFGLITHDARTDRIVVTDLGYDALKTLKVEVTRMVKIKVKIDKEILSRALKGRISRENFYSMESKQTALTRRHKTLTLETCTRKIPRNGLVVHVLKRLAEGYDRFNKIRSTDSHAYDVQTSLMLGLVDQKIVDGKKRYFLTVHGQAALQQVQTAPDRELCAACKKRVDCLVANRVTVCPVWISISIDPSKKWIDYFKERAW